MPTPMPMPILKVKVSDSAGAALAGQAVKVTGAGALQASAEGHAQFLIESNVPLDIEINGASAWSGNSAQLAGQELFKAAGAGFARVHSA